jgi:hypothetical protein
VRNAEENPRRKMRMREAEECLAELGRKIEQKVADKRLQQSF